MHSLTQQLCSLPCSQGRVGVGLLCASKIKSFTPPTSPCKQGEEQCMCGLTTLRQTCRLGLLFSHRHAPAASAP